jgi:hypothetical protein
MPNTPVVLVRLALPLLVLPSMAGPSSAGPADYNFQIVGAPTQTAAGTTIKVRLTYRADGPVTDAHVYYQSAQPLNAKAWATSGPRTAMQSDGHGNYTVVVRGPVSEGDPLHFIAEIPSHSSIVRAPNSAGASPASDAAIANPAETVSWSVRSPKT